MIDQLRTGWRLWRARHENPLYIYLDPRRRRWEGLVYRLGWLPLVLAVVIGVWRLLSPTRFSATFRGWQDGELAVQLLAGVFLVTPIFFFMILRPLWSRDRCIDLGMSQLAPAEIAFGFVIWPVLGTVRLIVGLQLLFVALMPFLRGWIPTILIPAVHLMGMTTALLCSLEWVAVRGRRRWWAGLLVPLKTLLLLVPQLGIAFLILNPLERRPILLSIAGLCYAAAYLFWMGERMRLVTNGLGERLMRSVAPEECLRAAWFERELATFRLPRRGLFPMRRLVLAWARSLVIEIPFLLAVSGLAWWWMESVSANSMSGYRVHHKGAVLAGAVFLAPLLVIASLTIRRLHQGSWLPVLSGSVTTSVLLHATPTVLIMSVLMLAITPIPALRDLPTWLVTTVLAVLAPMAAICVLAAALNLITRNALLPAIIMAALLLAGVAMIPISIHLRRPMDLGLTALALGCASLLFIESALLHLFREETYHVPLGRLTTDDNEGIAFASDELIEELAAEAEAQ